MQSAFFCLCNERDFVGLAALINSIRLVGHREPIFVTDCGLREEQQHILEDHVTLLPAPGRESPSSGRATGVPNPLGREAGYAGGKFGLQKAFGPLLVQPDVAVLLDADVIVLKPLTDLLQEKAIFFVDALPERSHPDWACLGYGHVSTIPYVNAGQLIISRASGLLPEYQNAVERMLRVTRLDPTKCRTISDPFYFGDQDALNALLASIDPKLYTLSEEAAYWPFEGPLDHARFLHHILAKPWLTPMRSNLYIRHMVRVLAEGPVTLPPAQLPRFLQDGVVGNLHRARRAARPALRDIARGNLGIGIRAKLARSDQLRRLR